MVRDGDSALQEGKAPAASTFTELDKNDLREFHRLYNFAKVDRVDSIIETCVSNGITPQELFNDLRTQYKITHLPDREGAARRFSDLVPEATEDDVESAPRLSEIHGFSESDALRALKRRLGAKHSSSLLSEEQLERSTTPAIIHDASLLEAGAAADDDHQQTTRLYSGPSREAIDAVMAEECREWVAQVIGEAYNADVLRETNFLDALRSGVVLLLLLQKLQDPSVPDAELKVPKRSRGFYARDNVVTFLKQAAAKYQLVEAQLFTDSDLCDGKNDRAVVTCLLSIARIAYTRGSTNFAPAMIIFEQEIEAKMKNLSQQQIDRVILEAEASEVNSESQDMVEGEGEGGEEDELQEKEDTCIIQRPIRLLAYEEMSPTVVVVKEEEVDENETQNKNVLIEPQDDKITTVPSIEESGMITTNNEARKEEEKENTPAETSCRISYLRGSVIKSDPAIGGGGDGDAPHVKEATSLLLPPNPKLEEKTEPNTVSAPDTKGGTGERNSLKATRYNPRRWDEIDMSLSVIVNDHFKKHPQSQIRFRRLSASAGEYVVYHRLLGHKRLMFARILQNQLMIRQFSPNIKTKVSAWEDLGSFLKRYEDEFKL